jgi:hypothetical protein
MQKIVTENWKQKTLLYTNDIFTKVQIRDLRDMLIISDRIEKNKFEWIVKKIIIYKLNIKLILHTKIYIIIYTNLIIKIVNCIYNIIFYLCHLRDRERVIIADQI